MSKRLSAPRLLGGVRGIVGSQTLEAPREVAVWGYLKSVRERVPAATLTTKLSVPAIRSRGWILGIILRYNCDRRTAAGPMAAY